MIYIGCSEQVQMLGLTNQATGAVINNAVITATVFDADNNQIYQTTLLSTGSDGNYSGTIPATITQAMQAGGSYTVTVVSTVSGTQIDQRTQTIQVCYRGINEQLL